MNFRIATLLPLVIAGLVAMAVFSSGLTAYRAWEARRSSLSFLEANQIAQLLLRSGGQWASERGLTNTALKAPEPISPERLAEIAKLRAGADQAFDTAIRLWKQRPELNAAQPAIDVAERTFKSVQQLRAQVDANLAKPADQRVPDVVNGWVPAVINLVDVAATKLRLAVESLSIPPNAALTQYLNVRHLAAMMAELAGQERAFLAGTIASRNKLSGDGVRRISELRGGVRLAWETLLPIGRRADAPDSIQRAVAAVEGSYFGSYDKISRSGDHRRRDRRLSDQQQGFFCAGDDGHRRDPPARHRHQHDRGRGLRNRGAGQSAEPAGVRRAADCMLCARHDRLPGGVVEDRLASFLPYVRHE
ncbi:nitrate- and nitrite sensing domain-containing protein [Bradyrhizobium betae]|uniref:nitrate- and nitrite sensing domain-containing protein n=1 Tax=Bradyrhizobium betae TaxID=244734 RepID=UPI003D671878